MESLYNRSNVRVLSGVGNDSNQTIFKHIAAHEDQEQRDF